MRGKKGKRGKKGEKKGGGKRKKRGKRRGEEEKVEGKLYEKLCIHKKIANV